MNNPEAFDSLHSNPAVDKTLRESRGNTAFLCACELGRLEMARTLLVEEKDVINNVNEDKQTALHLASINGNTEVVQMLLQQPGIDINEVAPIRQRGGNGELLDTNQYTPFLAACRVRFPKQSHFLKNTYLTNPDVFLQQRTPKNETAVMIAALSNSGTVLKLLLKTNSYDVNLTDNEGNTALHVASTCAVQILLLQNSPLLAQSPINQLLLLDDARVKADDKNIVGRSIIDMVASYMVHEDPVERAHASKFLEHSKIPHNLWSEPLACGRTFSQILLLNSLDTAHVNHWRNLIDIILSRPEVFPITGELPGGEHIMEKYWEAKENQYVPILFYTLIGEESLTIPDKLVQEIWKAEILPAAIALVKRGYPVPEK
eukprot:CAMPEP_0206206304 /NCGR_PEP_ID=MMETSP0166-20121206/14832_1 /ASSEMBLY_ACC=CAM_ASM_000260 /TAXON_ID=95228 /ORGANISM="Vannella robusta, Strain DIVA3 518/3/11/1/6" /LENGTH=373 /DNA_ID=CAMNT_0053626681 /DNA_START=489 /DNA_END=1607 /DNA_ORIENTATION=-